ncbi:ribosomal protein L7/L12 [Streptomyces cynarae]|uniref:Ribosomal protein L7/L12 n=1 Tax=Streptomyces cynarae TaxID=2981134 RepID=A0ABY6E562_9ACTN|nr:ribosomal protein L7/L12 [Streptomyces cynarae]UXY20951.1 ribosomal protein L7/L12 [Streptomyces cynarae]
MDMLSFLIVFALLVAGFAGVEARTKRTDRRMARVERKLDLVLDHLGLHEADPDLERVAALLRDGKNIQAIKVYREITGAGLKEAKEAVERMG